MRLHVIAHLRKLRRFNEITQRELSSELRMPITKITCIESGAQQARIGDLTKMADFFGYDIVLTKKTGEENELL
jgi:transcriptional regulator with XRE-family HTH domain